MGVLHQDSIQSPDVKAEESIRRGCWPGCLTLIAVLTFIFSLIAIATPFVIRALLRQGMSPADVAAMDNYRKKPVTIPKSWQEAEPFPRDVQESRARLVAVSDAQNTRLQREFSSGTSSSLGLTELQDGISISEEQWTSISDLLVFATPQLHETSESVRMAGYEIDVVADARLPTYRPLFNNVRLWVLTAHYHARNHQWQSAFDAAVIPLRMAQRHPATTVVGHMYGVSMENIALQTLKTLTAQCPDSAVLQKTLSEITSLDARLHHTLATDDAAFDAIAQLRQYKRLGYPVDLSSGKSASYYLNQQWMAKEAFPGWMLDHLPPGHVSRSFYDSALVEISNSRGVNGSHGVMTKVLVFLVPEFLLRVLGQPNYLENSIRLNVVTARFHLTRFHIAARIRQLQGLPVLKQGRAFVPEYLPVEPKDPFSGSEFLWDSATSQFYSVGPDKHDDKMKTRYGSPNGTLSAGDIAVRD